MLATIDRFTITRFQYPRDRPIGDSQVISHHHYAAAQVSPNDSHKGAPAAPKASIMKAGNITNSPCAKLMVPEACHNSVKPSAASA